MARDGGTDIADRSEHGPDRTADDRSREDREVPEDGVGGDVAEPGETYTDRDRRDVLQLREHEASPEELLSGDRDREGQHPDRRPGNLLRPSVDVAHR